MHRLRRLSRSGCSVARAVTYCLCDLLLPLLLLLLPLLLSLSALKESDIGVLVVDVARLQNDAAALVRHLLR